MKRILKTKRKANLKELSKEIKNKTFFESICKIIRDADDLKVHYRKEKLLEIEELIPNEKILQYRETTKYMDSDEFLMNADFPYEYGYTIEQCLLSENRSLCFHSNVHNTATPETKYLFSYTFFRKLILEIVNIDLRKYNGMQKPREIEKYTKEVPVQTSNTNSSECVISSLNYSSLDYVDPSITLSIELLLNDVHLQTETGILITQHTDGILNVEVATPKTTSKKCVTLDNVDINLYKRYLKINKFANKSVLSSLMMLIISDSMYRQFRDNIVANEDYNPSQSTTRCSITVSPEIFEIWTKERLKYDKTFYINLTFDLFLRLIDSGNIIIT